LAQSRENYNRELYRKMRDKYPSFNFVACHTKHTANFGGVKCTDWDNWNEEIDIRVEGTLVMKFTSAAPGRSKG